MQETASELQHCAVVVHEPPRPTQATLLTSMHWPWLQNPEQHWKPFTHCVAAAVVPGGVVSTQRYSVKNPRMFGVSSCPSR